MKSPFSEQVSVPHAYNEAVRLQDWTIDRLLQDRFPETRFMQRFRKDPFLRRVTLGQVMSNPFALNDFLAKCRTLPACGETSVSRLRWVIEVASAGLVAGAPDPAEAAIQQGTSCGAGRA